MVLANEISKNMQDFSKEEIIRYTERTHQVITANRSPSATSAPPFLVAKITNWDMLEKIKSAIIKANQEGNSAVFVSQMYSVSDRRKCGFEVLNRSQRARPVNPRLGNIPSHTND